MQVHDKLSPCLRNLLLWRDTMTMATLIQDSISLGLPYSFRGSDHHHHGRKHGAGGAKSSTHWSKGSQEETLFCTGQSLDIGDLRAHLQSDTPPPTRPCLLILPKTVPPTRKQAIKHMSFSLSSSLNQHSLHLSSYPVMMFKDLPSLAYIPKNLPCLSILPQNDMWINQ